MGKKPEVLSLRFGVIVIAVSFFLASNSFAADNESWIQKIKSKFQKKEVVESKNNISANEVKKAETPRKARKDMTKSELADIIVRDLDREESILNLVPGLEKKSDSEGKEYYTYNGTKLEGLDRDTLDKIYGRVRNEALRLRTDKLNRQIETVRRVNSTRVMVPQVPRTAIPPKINVPPQTPARTVQPPSRPPAPPALPRK